MDVDNIDTMHDLLRMKDTIDRLADLCDIDRELAWSHDDSNELTSEAVDFAEKTVNL